MYIRLKTIKNQKYAYLVNSKWSKRKKKSKQKTIKYIGKAIKPIKIQELTLSEEIFQNNFKKILKELIILELKNHNFKQINNVLNLNNITFNTKTLKLRNKDKPISLILNEGYMNVYTIKKLLKFDIKTENKLKEGKRFAKTLIATGIKITPEHFILLFQKLFKNIKTE